METHNGIIKPIIKSRFTILLALLVTSMLILAWPVEAEGRMSFGLRPAQQGIGYFTYSLGPGESISDEIIVSNSGDLTVTVKIYALDAHSARNGGVIFPGGEGSTNTFAGAWVSLSASRVTLEPGMGVTLPFTFTVPADARVGEHVAGIVAENTEPVTGEGQFVVQVIQRAALPIWETVPGPAVTDLQIGSVKHVVRGGNSSFDVELSNTGNVSIDATDGELEVRDRAGATIGLLPIKVMGKFLAGDTIIYPVNFEDLLPPGRYSVAVTANYGVSQPAIWESDFDVSKEEVKPTKEPLDRRFALPTRPAGEEPNYWMYATVGLIVILALAALVWGILHKKRSSGNERTQP